MFAYRTPTPNGIPIEFEPIHDNQINYLNIENDKMIMGLNPHNESIQFWDDLLAKYMDVEKEEDEEEDENSSKRDEL